MKPGLRREEDIPDVRGRKFVLTGGNSGIGFEAARMLVQHHGTVILACRDAGKMKVAAQALRAFGTPQQVEEVQLDLASLASIRTAAEAIRTRHPTLDVLINNAGVMAIPFRETRDGFEMQFGTNHLGHFALTAELFPALLAGEESRVVNVSSFLHQRGRLVLDDIPRPRVYDAQRAYAMSKLANLLFTYELDRRVRASGLPLRSVGCHPGYAATNLQGVGPRMSGSKWKETLMRWSNATLAQSAAMGALPTVWAATSTQVNGGDYVGPKGFFQMRGFPEKTESSAHSHDAALARRLWETSLTLTKTHFPGLELTPASMPA